MYHLLFCFSSHNFYDKIVTVFAFLKILLLPSGIQRSQTRIANDRSIFFFSLGSLLILMDVKSICPIFSSQEKWSFNKGGKSSYLGFSSSLNTVRCLTHDWWTILLILFWKVLLSFRIAWELAVCSKNFAYWTLCLCKSISRAKVSTLYFNCYYWSCVSFT